MSPEQPSCLTPREKRLLAAYGQYKSHAKAAKSMGMTEGYFRQAISVVYQKLDADCYLAAVEAIGWFNLPEQM